MRHPLNEQVIVGYQDSRWSVFNKVFISWIDMGEPCEKPNCEYTDEHYIFDGQIYFQNKKK